MTQSETSQRVSALLEKKLALFRHYLALTEKMQARVENDDPDDIVNFLSQRADCIGRIDHVDRAMDSLVSSGWVNSEPMAGDLKKTIDACLLNIKKTMTSVSSLEAEILDAMSLARNDLKSDLLRRGDYKRAARGYRSGPYQAARFLEIRK